MKKPNTLFYGKTPSISRKDIKSTLKQTLEDYILGDELYEKTEAFVKKIYAECDKLLDKMLSKDSFCKKYAMGYYEIFQNAVGEDEENVQDAFRDYDEKFLLSLSEIKALIERIKNEPNQELEVIQGIPSSSISWAMVAQLWDEYCAAQSREPKMHYLQWISTNFNPPVKK